MVETADGIPGLVGDQELAGEVAAVVFTNPATGFGVVELTPSGLGVPDGARTGAPPRASGPLADLVEGQAVRLSGRWTAHERYGPTFAATTWAPAAPRSPAALVTFLSSDRFPGVGTTLAQRLVARFGLDLGDVIDREPELLAEVRGVSAELAGQVADAWRRAGALAGLVGALGAAGVPPGIAHAAHRRLGDDAEALLARDPFALLDVRGASWQHAEALARAAGIGGDDPRRLVAGAVAAQRQATGESGSTALEDGALLTAARRLLGTDDTTARRALDLAGEAGRLERDDGSWYLPEDLAAERQLAAELVRLARATPRTGVLEEGFTLDPQLTPEQRLAVEQALVRGVSVLTGGPGTGKTRTVTELVRACEARGLRVALCAPTGRAARRLEELTDRGATTVHRLLEARGVPGAGFTFGYDATRRLPQDVVVADEWSMADTRLARALVRAVPDGAHLVLVGDADQLPSVGPGAVLRDLLAPEAAPVVAATTLTHVHRQAAQSRIVTLAHEIDAGSPPAWDRRPRRDGDVFVVPERSAGVPGRVAAIVAERAPSFYGLAPSDVQVLAPMYRGPAGVDALNAALKAALNPGGNRPAVAGFHEGDRVVQTRNDVELDVANGDVGEVAVVDRAARTLEVQFPSGPVTYDAERAADLAPAWCLTVHKSQGGEWPVVVVVLDPGHRTMLTRELVYTAVTRAARGLLLVGDPTLLAAAARRPGGGARGRRTGLTARLAAAWSAQGPAGE